MRETLNEGLPEEEQLSLNDMLLKAAAIASEKVPDVRSFSFTSSHQSRPINTHIELFFLPADVSFFHNSQYHYEQSFTGFICVLFVFFSHVSFSFYPIYSTAVIDILRLLFFQMAILAYHFLGRLCRSN